MAHRGVSVEVPGLAKLRRDLKKIDGDAAKELTSELRQIAKDVRDDARSRAPVKTGALRGSIKHSVRARGASVYSNSPYAAVQEWGGTIRPKGTPIRIRGRHFIYSAIDDNTEKVVEKLGDSIERIARSNGFH